MDESLVRRHEGSQAELRFSMLDTIREYATEELSASGLEQSIRQRHADYFIRLADASRLAPFLPGGGKLFAQLRLERPDLRAALEWLALGDARNLLRLTGSLGWFWSIYGSFSEGKMWLERALERSSEATVAEQASALCALGAMWNCLGNRQRALEICDQAVARFRETTDAHGLAVALRLCSIIDEGPAGQKRSKRRLTEALNLVDSQGDAAWAPFLEGTLLCDLGKIALSEGDIVLAESYHQQAIARMDDVSQGLDEPPIMTCEPRFGLAEVFRARRQHAEALGWYQDCLRYAVLHGFQWAIVSAFAGIAGCLAASGRWAEAAHYFGVSDAFGDSTGVPFHSGAMDRQRAFGLPEPWLRADEPLGQYAELQDAIRHLQKTEFPPVPDVSAAEIHWAEGRLVALNDAISDALSIDPQCTAPGAPVNHPFGLTPREVEVLHLLVDGQSDRDIASTLFISSRTAEKHVQAILGKLNVTSRTAAATLALRRELG